MNRRKRVYIRALEFTHEYGPHVRTVWSGGYQMNVPTKEGVRMAHVTVDVHSTECPKSALLRNPEAAELVQIATQAEASGVDALGPAREWSGAFYDAMTIIAQQRLVDESAQRQAVQKL